MGFTAALGFVKVLAAYGAKSFTIIVAKVFGGKRELNIFLNKFVKVKSLIGHLEEIVIVSAFKGNNESMLNRE